MAHGLNPIIKCEMDYGNSAFSKSPSTTSLVGNSAITMAVAQTQPSSIGTQSSSTASNSNTSQNDGNGVASSSGGSGNNTGASGNNRMGSRRIFTPQFKLQVLESYRSDSDCKGNQRATARKYGIHRRQIQKWLQCENALRSSVATQNQNNVKHQFHNMSHHPIATSTVSAINTHSKNTNNNHHVHHMSPPARHLQQLHHPSVQRHHNQHHQPQTSQLPSYKNLGTASDAARQSVAITPSSLSSYSPPAATVRLVPAIAPTKCMNGGNVDLNLSLAQSSVAAATNPIPLHRSYSQTPAMQAVPLIHHHHPTHHQHHQLGNGSGAQHIHHHQHDPIVLMPSSCLTRPILPISASAAQYNAHESRDYQPISAVVSASATTTTPTGNSYTIDCSQKNPGTTTQPQSVYDSVRQRLTCGAVSSAPIDLSVTSRHPKLYDHQQSIYEAKWREPNNNNDQEIHIKEEPGATNPIVSQAVDLRCRKRTNYQNDETTPPEKVHRVDEQDAEVGSVKPVKLFKPYLLDEEKNEDEEKFVSDDQKDAIIWSNHPIASLTSTRYEMHSTHSSNFQSPASHDANYTFPIGSPSSTATVIPCGGRFQNERSASPFIATTTATITSWCPKGSPVSGYDTASTYSDSSDHNMQSVAAQQQYLTSPNSEYRCEQRRAETYNLDLKMQRIVDNSQYYDMTTCRIINKTAAVILDDKNNDVQSRSDVQRWLFGQEINHRQGIAVYV